MSSPTVSQIPAAFYAASSAFGYLLGSIPTGYLVGRRYGIDIREHGSGNIGATNVVRVLGKKPGYFVFACDMLKGLSSTFLGLWIARIWHPGIMDVDINQVHSHFLPLIRPETLEIAAILGALGCILGHNFPVWLRFRGGKGVATTVGVLLGLMPAAFLVAAIVWGATFYLSRYVSLASLAAAAVLPVTVWWFTWRASGVNSGIGPLFWFSVVAAALVFLRHRANIARLLNGTESRFTAKPKTAGTR